MRQTSSKRSHRFLSTWHGAALETEVLQGDIKLEGNQAMHIKHDKLSSN